MANHASHAALPYPIKGARYTLLIPYLDADGDPTDPTTPDTEVSKDDGAAADTAEEVASPKNSVGMLTLSGAETDASALSLAAKAASGPKSTLMTLYPRNLAVVGSGTLSAGSAGGGTLGTLLAYDVTGCFIKTTGGTGGGGTGGANNQARRIITYNTGTGAFTVSPNWETTPSTDTTYDVLLPEGVTLGMLKTLNPATAGRTADIDSSGRVLLQPTQTGVTIPTVTTLTGHTAQTGDAYARLGAPAGASIAADIATRASQASVDAIDDFLDTEIAAILAAVDTEIGTILTRLGVPATSIAEAVDRLTAARAGYLDNLSAGAVALDATVAKTALFSTTTRNDPAALASALASGLTPLEKLDWILAFLARQGDFNRTTGERIVYNASGVAIAKMTCSDDGTTTERGQPGAP